MLCGFKYIKVIYFTQNSLKYICINCVTKVKREGMSQKQHMASLDTSAPS